MPGVVRVIQARDIPGENNFAPWFATPEEVLCSGHVDFGGQAVAIVVADTQTHADEATKRVVVTYKNVQKPLIGVRAAVAAESFFSKNDPLLKGNPDDAIEKAPHSVSGEVCLETQYPFYMELQVSIVNPTDEGYQVYAGTQHVDVAQSVVAKVLGIKNSAVGVQVRRLGGGFGGKISRSHQVTAAAAIAAGVCNRPVRLFANLKTCMKMIGMREPYLGKYKVGFDDDGKLLGVDVSYYCNGGNSPNDCDLIFAVGFGDNAYSCDHWRMSGVSVKTNEPGHSYVRSPGSLPGIFIMESMMEHIAKTLNKDVMEVRRINLYKEGQTSPCGQPLPFCNVDSLWEQLQESASVKQRTKDVEDFNQSNRWKKRGLSVVPLKYCVPWQGIFYGSQISIYNSDGAIAINHGGVEVGQGIDTKVIQVAARELKVDMSMITVKPTDSLLTPNSQWTGASVTSELNCMAIMECCKQLNDRIDPVRQKMKPDYTWQDLIRQCYNDGVDMTARHWMYPRHDTPFKYCSYGVCCCEAEVDILTGETQILRSDVLYDCGVSTNPEIDVGQAEGAFVMGLGYWLTEHVVYDENTGENLFDGTWKYKPPTTKDIPIDFRVTFLQNAPNPLSVLRSKAVGEPPLIMSSAVVFAVKRAIEAARAEIGQDTFFAMDVPTSVDQIQTLCLVDPSQFSLK